MKDTAPLSEGIIAVAALFGIIAAGVAFVLYDFSAFAAACIGGGLGLVVAIVLAIGWRAPARGPEGPETRSQMSQAAAPAPAAKAESPAPAAPAAKKASTEAPAAKPEANDAPAGTSPAFLSAARDGGPDDLKKIKGVGPKLEKTLHEMGIYHFDQIAEWGPSEQAWMDENLEGFKGRATRDDWVPQAKILAAGGETEFSKKSG